MKKLLKIVATLLLAVLLAWWLTDGNSEAWGQSLFLSGVIVCLPYLVVPTRWKFGYVLLGGGLALLFGIYLVFGKGMAVEVAAVRALLVAVVITVTNYLIQKVTRRHLKTVD